MENRKVFSSFVTAILAGGFLWSPVQADGSANPPNVLFIAIDDLNDWIGALHTHSQVKTPNIDRLAQRGTLFTNAHAQAPLCNPSRISLMTSQRPSTTGIYNLAPRHLEVESTRGLITLPRYFAMHGYRTLSTGKIFHGGVTEKEREVEFHEWGPDGGVGRRPARKLVDEPVHMGNHPLLDWGPTAEGAAARGDYHVATWAERQLEQLGRQESGPPFFLAVGFFLPHVPLYAPQEWFDLYPDDESIVLPVSPVGERDDVPDFAWKLHWYLPEPRLSWLIEHDQWRPKVRAYLATISFMDAQVGRVLDALEANGLNDDTIVVLWSDHGYHLGEKEITGKNTLWERSTRVPLIFAGPGVATGARSSRPVELLDMYPTLVELAGLPEKEGLEGISLRSQLEDADAPRERPAITTHNPGNHAVRSERWRYIRYADGSEELYDHVRDPHEWANLAANPEYAEVVADHARWLPDDTPHVPGSSSRLLVQEHGEWFWEGKRISFDELIR
jgi:arylsulfatase A-like enzyme